MQEKELERKLAVAVKRAGGLALKFVSPGYAGVPDRLVLLPGGVAIFVEVKAPGMKPRPLQMRRHRVLRRPGFKVYMLDDVSQIGAVLEGV
jgi:hypothetical protein